MLFGGFACTPEGGEEGDNSYAELSVSPASISATLEGATETLSVTSNASWVVTCDQSDVVISTLVGKGNATVNVEIPSVTAARNFVIKFVASKNVTVAGVTVPSVKEFDVQVSQNATGTNLNEYAYYEDCGTDVEKDGSYWPYVDKFYGWNPLGDAATAVTYGGNNASVRASGGNYQPTEDAIGVSGQPYVFLNKVPASAHFVIKDIAVKGGSQYVFTFNVSCQNAYVDGKPGFAEITNDLVHLELGYDGTNWAKVNFTAAPNGGNGWYATTTEFKTAADATKLYARFTYEAPAANGGGRFDDFKLVEGGNGGELDFTVVAPTPDPTPDPTPTPADAYFFESFTTSQGEFTINDVTLTGDLTYVWKHESGQYGTYMKASGYKGSATASESWLISPAISLAGATKPAVSFDHCHKFAGTPSEELTLWVSENDGVDWTQLTISTYGTNSDYNFVTNTTDLTAYVGKTVKIALKYVSTTSAAATWEVNNFKVAEGNGDSGDSGNEGGDNTGAEATGVFTSDAAFVCSADNSGNKVYTLGASTINGQNCSGFKLGTSNNAGFFTSAAVGVSGTKTLGFYAMAWKAKTATIYIKVEGSDEVKSVAVKANDGATGNPPYTITVTDADYYSVELAGLTETSKVLFSTDATFSTATSTAARAVVAGVTLK